MAGRSPNNNANLLTAGIVGVGVGVLVAGIMSCSSSSNQGLRQRSQSPKDRSSSLLDYFLSPTVPTDASKNRSLRDSSLSPSTPIEKIQSQIDNFLSPNNPGNESHSPINDFLSLNSPRVGRQRQSQEKNFSSPSLPRVDKCTNKRDVKRNPVCKICEKEFHHEPSITLDCCHIFHRKCLFSSYIVQTQMNKNATFLCPIDKCQENICHDIIESLVAFH